MDFEKFPKIPRLNRDITISEKLDGTNAAVLIENFCRYDEGDVLEPDMVVRAGDIYRVQAQSRNRLITPGKTTDNYGFAAWVQANAAELVEILGPGRHFGEWWGTGIARGYGLESQRNFSLFRPRADWHPVELEPAAGMTGGTVLDVVPVLYSGPFRVRNEANGEDPIGEVMWELRHIGSVAAPGFMNPEGIIVYHTAAGQLFKVTCEDDDKPKEVVARETAKVAANGGGKVTW